MTETVDRTAVRCPTAFLGPLFLVDRFSWSPYFGPQLVRNFGRTNATWLQGDFNYDGTVNLADFLQLKRNFGKNYLTLTSALAASPVAMLPSSGGNDEITRRRRA